MSASNSPLSSLAPGAALRTGSPSAAPVSASDSDDGTKNTYEVYAKVEEACPPDEKEEEHHYHHRRGNGGWAWGVIVFVILVIIIWVILYLWCPEFVQKTCKDYKTNGEFDGGKALLWAVIIAIIICILIAVFWWATI